jgi:orotidine-5'-phosphate decarboxylase
MRRRTDRLIVALDAPRLSEALAMARRLRGVVRTVKVGSALFTAHGPVAIRRLRALGFGIMLDLKFFDIPSMVAASCRAAVRHRVSLLTVHASGGREMLQAAVEAVRSEARSVRVRPPLVLGVTVLTSVGAADGAAMTRRVLELARGAVRSGCDGVVASAHEAAALRRRLGRRPAIVCPGIRPASSPVGDQRRVCTAGEAITRGADWLVVGRPITQAAHPQRVAKALLMEMEAVDGC